MENIDNELRFLTLENEKLQLQIESLQTRIGVIFPFFIFSLFVNAIFFIISLT